MRAARACLSLADQRQRASIALLCATAPQLALIDAALHSPSEIALMHATEIVGGPAPYRRSEDAGKPWSAAATTNPMRKEAP